MAALDFTTDDEQLGGVKAKEIKALIEKMWNANHQLQRIIKNYEGVMGDRASPFVQVNKEWFAAERGDRNDRTWLDSINGRPGHETRMLLLSRQQNLSLRGWVQAPLITLSPSLPIFVCLESLDNKNLTYFAAVYDREPREDIVVSLNLTESSLWCGFSVKADMAGVTYGRYRISFKLSMPGDLKAFVSVPTFIELMVS